MLSASSDSAGRSAGFIPPCLPVLSRSVPEGPEWVYEIKHDGMRLICQRDGDQARAFSETRLEWTDRVPLIVAALRSLPVSSVTLDGEGVVCDERGISDFDRLLRALGQNGSREPFLYAFDLLELNGQDMRSRPWQARRETLEWLLGKSKQGIRLCEHFVGAGDTVFRHVCSFGLEGIVAKRRDRPYWSGRCADWVKVKNPKRRLRPQWIERP
jgi:bifunctional non-homologous end joining protein LigD